MTDDDMNITTDEMKKIIDDGLSPVTKSITSLTQDIQNFKADTKKEIGTLAKRLDVVESKQETTDKEVADAMAAFQIGLDAVAQLAKTERGAMSASLNKIEVMASTTNVRLEAMEAGHVQQQTQLDNHTIRLDKHSEGIDGLREQQHLTTVAVRELSEHIEANTIVANNNAAAIARTEKNTEDIAIVAKRMNAGVDGARYVIKRVLGGSGVGIAAIYLLELIASALGIG